MTSFVTSPTQHRLMDNPPVITPPAPIIAIGEECGRITAEFPGWHVWVNIDGKWCAWRESCSPQGRVSADGPVELRQKLRQFVP